MNTLRTAVLAAAAVAFASPAAMGEVGGFKPNVPESFYADHAYGAGARPAIDVVNWQYWQHKKQMTQQGQVEKTGETAEQASQKGLRVGQPGNPPRVADPKNTIE